MTAWFSGKARIIQARSGIRLKRGDVLSLGSFTPLLPPRGGTTIKVRYFGLPGDPEVSVRFK